MNREEAMTVISNLLEQRKKYLSGLAKCTEEIGKLEAEFKLDSYKVLREI